MPVDMRSVISATNHNWACTRVARTNWLTSCQRPLCQLRRASAQSRARRMRNLRLEQTSHMTPEIAAAVPMAARAVMADSQPNAASVSSPAS